MPLYSYKARDSRTGSLVTGSVEEATVETLESSLDSKGLIPISISETSPVFNFEKFNTFFQKVTVEDKIIFTRQMATLFSAGIPFIRSLDTLANQTVNPKMKEVIYKVKEDVESGMSFANSLGKHPKVFDDLYINMIAAGEEGGILDDILDRLAMMAEKEEEIRSKVKSSTLYPKIVVGAIFCAALVMLYFVVPRFAKLYASFNAQLPLPTRMLIAMSGFVQSYWYVILAAIGAIYATFKSYIATDQGHYKWDGFMLHVPVFGILNTKVAMSRFSRTFGTLFKSGLPILQTIDIVSNAIGNVVIAEVLMGIKADVQAGTGLAESMREHPVFPPIVVQMVEIGEESGSLDTMLNKISEYFDQEVDYGIKNLITALEPILLVFIFGMVLFLALAVFLPMWDIVKFARH